MGAAFLFPARAAWRLQRKDWVKGVENQQCPCALKGFCRIFHFVIQIGGCGCLRVDFILRQLPPGLG